MKIPVKPKRKLATIDQNYEAKLQEYINKVLEMERKKYHSDLEPFEVYAEKLKKEIEDYYHNFYLSFHHGYKVLADEMKKHRS